MARKELNDLAVSAFCESMGMMLQSGITVEEALDLLRPKEEEGELSSVISGMISDLDSLSLSKAMEKSGAFPEYAVSMVTAAEKTGRMESTMFHLSDYYKTEKKMKDDLRSALIYPSAMIIMIIAVLFIMLKMVLPVFMDVYESMSGDLSSGTFPYVRTSHTLCLVLLIVMIVILACVLVGVFMWKNNGRRQVEKILRRIPLCAKILDTLALLRFTSAYDMYLSSGEMQDEALIKSMPLANDEMIEAKLQRIAAMMKEGNGFGKSAYSEDLYGPVYGRTLIPAERSGNIENALKRLIDLLRDDSADNVSKLVNTLEPLLSGLLMIAVAIVLLSLMLPLIGIMNSIA
ncbi:MAG: type II secretion system F family protein [Erysipelotrichaceae bacterium]|nr:type II secretion system F family protein [Erysipelotrichaceae bacterium]